MLTKKQRNTLDIIKQFNIDNGYTPSLKEVATLLNVKSLSSVHHHFKELINKGYLHQESNYGGVSINEHNSTSSVPLVGTITAGMPIDIYEDTEGSVALANLPDGDFYALSVKGDSMIDDGIFDGDIVVIKKQSSAINGQTVVAVIDDEMATLKKLYKEKNRFRLQPANQSLLPIFRDEVEIRGLVWEIRRGFTNKTNKTKTWKTIDLFAGVGGIRLGFEKAGFKTVFANDFEKACAITYDSNYIETKLTIEDITKIKVEDLPEFDFLLGGFPCQAFSIAGARQGFDDDKGRGNLFFDIVRIIKDRKPEGFLLENVKNLKSHDGGRTFEIIEQTLKDLGYPIKAKVLNTMEYGNLPQNRERIYIVGFKDHAKLDAFEFPEKIELTKKITDFLEKKVDEKYYYEGKPLYERIKDDVKELGQVYQWRRKYVRQNKKGVCPTLTANMGMGGHNVPIIYDGKGIRKLTPRECFSLQGFPTSYNLPKDLADSALYKQAGNSVSVPVLERVAALVKNTL